MSYGIGCRLGGAGKAIGDLSSHTDLMNALPHGSGSVGINRQTFVALDGVVAASGAGN